MAKKYKHFGKPIIRAHTLPPPRGLKVCNVVLDVGAGLRPMTMYRPARHICVEPYGPYCKVLRTAGYEVLQGTAEHVLSTVLEFEPKIDAIFLLDVIEHMEKDVGRNVIELAKQVAREQIVLYTPVGFMKQTEDNWGMGGHEWQTHRSGWQPDEFPGWHITLRSRRAPKGFIALWNNPTR